MKAQVKGKSKSRKRSSPLPSASIPVRLIGGDYEIANRWPVAALAGLTFLLSLPLFAPWSFWLVGYVVFTPWLVAVCIARRAGWMYLVSYLLGVVFFLWHLRWMYFTTPPGYILGSLFVLATGFPLAAWPIRHLNRTRGLSVAISFPIVWVAIEMIRSHGPLGFPWFLLGHSQIRILTMIQIADVVGVYGVSFAVALVNGWITDLLLRPILIWWGTSATSPRKVPVGTVFMVIVFGATVVYGRYRLSEYRTTPGPKIAVLQGDFVLSTSPGPNTPTEADKWRTYRDLIDKAVAHSPDMVVLPETPWSMYLQVGDLYSKWNDVFVDLATRHKASFVVGCLREDPQPTGAYPEVHRYNSAFVYMPNVKIPQRYDKIHLVPFGEFVPFRYSQYFHWLYRLFHSPLWNPWGSFEYSLTAGTDYSTFAMQSRSLGGNPFRFGITICYEDVIPDLFRRFVVDRDGTKRAEFMLNISNDGWFGRGTQQGQHLVSCAFRAVENRIGIARSVNTGISGFLDSYGAWHDLMVPKGELLHAGGTGFRVAHVQTDLRATLYSRYGDIFGWACTGLTILMISGILTASVRGWHTSRRARKQTVAT